MLAPNWLAILADANKLNDVAGWYHHPETPVTSSVAVTRNFFTRPSAEEHSQTMEEEEERACGLLEAAREELQQLTVKWKEAEQRIIEAQKKSKGAENLKAAIESKEKAAEEALKDKEAALLAICATPQIAWKAVL